jgi:hypothetical protein
LSRSAERLVVVEVRNVGRLPVTVASWVVEISPTLIATHGRAVVFLATWWVVASLYHSWRY